MATSSLRGLLAGGALLFVALACFIVLDGQRDSSPPRPPAMGIERASVAHASSENRIGEQGTRDRVLPLTAPGSQKKRIQGRVISQGTKLPVDARVASGGRVTWTARTTGEFTLDGASVDVEVSADGYKPLTLAPASDYVLVEMEPERNVRIVVQDASGRATAGAVVEMVFCSLGAEPSSSMVIGVTDGSGALEFRCSSVFVARARSEGVQSPPAVVSPGENTLCCDPSLCCDLELVDEVLRPVKAAIVLDSVDGIFGIRSVITTGADGRAEVMIPRGRYAAMVPEHGRIVGLDDAVALRGQLLDVSSVGGYQLRIASGAVRRLRVLDQGARQPVPSTLVLEALKDGDWAGLGIESATDMDGFVEVDCLAQSTLTLDPRYCRIRVHADGYQDAIIDPGALKASTEIWLQKSTGSSASLRIAQDDRAYRGQLVLVETAAPAGGSRGRRMLYDGSTHDELSMDLASCPARIELYSSDDEKASRLGVIEVREGKNFFALPPSGAITVQGVPATNARIGAKRFDGIVVMGVQDEGRVAIRGLLPGQYMVGPVDVLSTGDGKLWSVLVDVAPGSDVVVSGGERWVAGKPLAGRVFVTGGMQGVQSEIWIVPCYGTPGRGGRDALRFGYRVLPGGEFTLPALAPPPPRLAVYSMLPNGDSLLVGVPETAPAVTVEGRGIALDMTGQGADSAVVLLIAPVGGGAMQFLIPCRTEGVLSLGIVPPGVASVVVQKGDRAIELSLPAQAGTVPVRF